MLTRAVRSPWLFGAVLGLYALAFTVAFAVCSGLQRFDEGIQLAAVSMLADGRLPLADFYIPYGLGYGLPGLPGQLLTDGNVVAVRLGYAVFTPIALVLTVVWAQRRAGWLLAVPAGLLCLQPGVPRYAMAWCAVLGFCLLVEHAARRSSQRTLTAVAREHPRRLLAAGAVLSLAAWVRNEYVLLGLLWVPLLWLALPPGRARRLQVGAVAGLSLLPAALAFGLGDPRNVLDYVTYSLFEFREFRGQPVDWSFPLDWASGVVHLRTGPDAAAPMAFYGVMAIAAGAWLVNRLLPVGRRFLRRDELRLTPYLVLAGAIVLYGNLARYSTAYSEAALPIGCAAIAAIAGCAANPRARIAAAALIAVLALQLLPEVGPTVLRDRFGRPDQSFREPIPTLNRVPLQADEAQSLSALSVVWRERVRDRRLIFMASRRNHTGRANEPIVYSLLHAGPAAWPVTYDPGLVTRDDLQRRAVADLCRHRAPIVQLDHDYPGPKLRTGSTRVDQYIAAYYRLEAVAGFYRLLLPEAGPCPDPDRLGEPARRERRDLLIARDDLPGAGALGVLGIERAQATQRTPAPEDVAIAVAGGFPVRGEWIPPGPAGAGLRSLVSGRQQPGVLAAAALDGPALVRLANQIALNRFREPEREPGQAAAAVEAVNRLAREHPQWPEAIRNLAALQPPSDPLFAALERRGAERSALLRWRFDTALASGTSTAAYAAGRELAALLASVDPVRAGAVELAVAERLQREGLANCAAALRVSANARPGVKVPGAGIPAPPCELPG